MVVVKQFCFATLGSSWSAFTAHEREIQVLRGLNHPGIPKYLGAFETVDGFCLIQEYKNALTLAVKRSFDAEEVKQIAIKVLEILVYLQNRIPPVIHRDIKPENILVDEQLNVYLIDFGMSRIGSEEVFGSSIFKGTPGFLPPEQIRQPTIATDLYGLGATLICLLTGTPSTQIQKLTDDDDPYVYHFRHLLPQLSLRFLNWLELMVQPRLKDRFANAQVAIDALKPLDVVRTPGIKLSVTEVSFSASRLGENLTQTITVENPIPDTVLHGKWVVAPHPQDPPHTPDSHSWISVNPAQFRDNNTTCRVQVDTSELMAGKLYERQLILHTNAYPEIYTINIKVNTANFAIKKRKTPYVGIVLVMLTSAIISGFLTSSGLPAMIVFACFSFSVIFTIIAALIDSSNSLVNLVLFLASLTFLVIGSVWIGIDTASIHGNLIGVLSGHSVMYLVALLNRDIYKYIQNIQTVGKASTILLIFAAGLGATFGIGCILGFFNPYILSGMALTGLPLATMLLHPIFKQRKLIAKYRQSEEHLIKP
jgi:serine/threonine protein kinase